MEYKREIGSKKEEKYTYDRKQMQGGIDFSLWKKYLPRRLLSSKTLDDSVIDQYVALQRIYHQSAIFCEMSQLDIRPRTRLKYVVKGPPF